MRPEKRGERAGGENKVIEGGVEETAKKKLNRGGETIPYWVL